jgi:5,5'-dehydrodivanillate O-demethylase
MLTEAENELLTRVGPGTPMGELMRRYWHPVAAVSQLKDVHTMRVRLLGEDLVLYRDRSGTYGLMDPFCPHRRMSMMFGVPETEGLRCAYHGWLFNETGKCLEMPYEETEEPNSGFKEKVTIKTYPAREHGGMIFAYLGPQPAPLLPPFDLYVMENVLRDVGYAELACNWLQTQENSLDPVHVEWLHQHFANYTLERMGRSDLHRPPAKHVKIHFDAFEYGIIKRRVVEGGSEDDDDWKVGHPALFPNYLRQGGGGLRGRSGGGGFQVRVPIDDTHTAHWWYRCHPMMEGDKPQAAQDIPFYLVPVPELDEKGQPGWDVMDNNSGQDITAWITQGPIADRTKETLGRSDRGIILYRQQLKDALKDIAEGRDPMCVFRDPSVKRVEFHSETNARFGQGGPQRQRGGASTKYSPILIAREGEVKYT